MDPNLSKTAVVLAARKGDSALFDALLARMKRAETPGFILGRLVGVAAGLCDDARIDEAEAFFRPRLEHLEGADKHLTQALELGRLCARFRTAQQLGVGRAVSAPRVVAVNGTMSCTLLG